MKKYNKMLFIIVLFISIIINFIFFSKTININQLNLSHTDYAKYIDTKIDELKSQYATLESNVDELNSNLTLINTYSSEETPIGKWIDEMTIYKAIINISNLKANGYTLLHTIPNFDTPIRIYGHVKTDINNIGIVKRSIPFVNPSENGYSIGWYLQGDGGVYINVAENYQRYSDIIIVCEYTKITE